MIDGFSNVCEYYLARSHAVVSCHPGAHVLKTDLYNEERDLPIKGGIACNLVAANVEAIEYDEQRVFKAREVCAGMNFVENFRKGDIRFLPYNEGAFDVVLDLSTIDHLLPEMLPGVIAGYANVLKPGGSLLLVSWCDPAFKAEKITNYSPTTQYYLSTPMIKEELEKHFELKTFDLLIEQDGKQLLEFGARRR
jgi:SAM-dependent methyltransferase